VYFCK
jgi:hypothetical protein